MSEPTRPLRVLRVIARLNVGGPALHTVILNDGLRQRGIDTMLVYGAVGPDEATLEGLALERALPVTHIPELGRTISPLDDPRAFATLLKLMWQWQPDVVHTHTAKAGTLGRLAALVYNTASRRRRRCAVVHTFHGHVFEGYFGRLGSTLVRLVERALALVTDRIIAISARQFDDLTRRFGVARPGRVVIVPLGLELGPLLALRERAARVPVRPGPEAGGITAGYVGRLVPIKNLDTLVQAIARASTRLPRLRLRIAGDGEERARLEAQTTELGLTDRVEFLGWRRDLATVYETMDVFVLTSLNEGTPVSLIEAMAAGVPVVATAVGGVPDVVEHGVTGILVPPQQPDAIADAIVDAVVRPASAARMAAAARLVVRERFDSARLVRDVEALYRQTLRDRRGAAVTPAIEGASAPR